MTPKLSIIIPCYNCEKTLHEAVESCYLQGFTENEFEIILVDDKSTDKTIEVMESLKRKYDNISLFFHEVNRGGGATRNTAVSNSSAEVIFCLDSDDILGVGTLKKMYSYLLKKNCDGVSIHYSINFKKTNLTDIDHIVTMSYVDEIIPFESLFQKDKIRCGLYQVFMFTKNAFEKAGGYPTDHNFDTQGFAWRFLSSKLVAYTCPDTFYFLRINFHESYYLRDYNQGKINFNWQKIFLEHSYLFKKETIDFITNFDVADFTRDIFKETISRKDFLTDNYQNTLGSQPILTSPQINAKKPISRNSLRGIIMRVRNKIKNNF